MTTETLDRPNGAGNAPAPQMPVFYRNVRPLDSNRDAGRSLKPLDGFGFAARTNSVALNIVEFPLAMRSYPIVFSAEEPRTALAVLGLVDGENLFVGKDNAWKAECYVPAYVRRYPFILMEPPGGSNDLIVCIDEGSGLLADDASAPLFKDGKPSEALDNALAFCRAFHAENAATLAFVRALKELDLLVPNVAQVKMRSGQEITLGGFEIIDEKKFNALPDEVFLDWRKRNWLHLAYCHFMSMANWSRLVELEAQRLG